MISEVTTIMTVTSKVTFFYKKSSIVFKQASNVREAALPLWQRRIESGSREFRLGSLRSRQKLAKVSCSGFIELNSLYRKPKNEVKTAVLHTMSSAKALTP